LNSLSCIRRLALVATAATALSASAASPTDDPHHTAAGFFDIHVCNWPDQPPFLMALFSTKQFRDIVRIDLIAPDGSMLGPMDLNRYRATGGGTDEKRVLMTHYPIPDREPEGWYRARIALNNGTSLESSDRVVKAILPFASGQQPRDGAEGVAMPSELKWNPVPGASHYQIYLRDEWESERHLLISAIITETTLKLPSGLLKPGGSYSWRVHARDMNGSPVWGDFNHGSLARETRFSVAD
jgi:hypothetical protein